MLLVAGLGCRDAEQTRSGASATDSTALAVIDTAALPAEESALCSQGAKDDAVCTLLRNLRAPIAKGMLVLRTGQQVALYEFPIFLNPIEGRDAAGATPRVGVGPFETLGDCQTALDGARAQNIQTGPCRSAEVTRPPPR